MQKTKMPEEIKKKILNEKNIKKIIELENKYAEKYLLDDEIINHELKYSDLANWDENYYIRPNK